MAGILVCFMLVQAVVPANTTATKVLAAEMETEATDRDLLKEMIKITDMEVSSKEVKPNETLKYKISLNIDEEKLEKYLLQEEYGDNIPSRITAGINFIDVYWADRPGTAKRYDSKKIKKGKDYIIEDGIEIRKGMPAETRKIYKICIKAAIKKNGYYWEGKDIEIYNNNTAGSWYHGFYKEMSALDFSIVGTSCDNKKPRIHAKTAKISKKKVKRKRNVTFSIKITDESAIQKVWCWCTTQRYYKGEKQTYSEPYDMKYNKKTKRYECKIPAGKRENVTKGIKEIYAMDEFDNMRIVSFNSEGTKEIKKAYKRCTFYVK